LIGFILKYLMRGLLKYISSLILSKGILNYPTIQHRIKQVLDIELILILLGSMLIKEKAKLNLIYLRIKISILFYIKLLLNFKFMKMILKIKIATKKHMHCQLKASR
jgi:hypothetical protein